MTDTTGTLPAQDPTSGEPPLCSAAEDFWSADSRAAIGRFIAPFLVETASTPLELLHAPRLQQAFEAHAVRRTVCDRAARVQATLYNLPPATRARELDGLIKEAAGLARQRTKVAPPTVVKPAGYVAAVGALTGKGTAQEAAFSIDATVTLSLAGCKDRSAKIALLLDFCDAARAAEEAGDGAAAPALDHADAFLGEHLAAPGALRALASHIDTLGELLTLLLDLYLGKQGNPDKQPPLVTRLGAVLAARSMPGTRDGLVLALQEELQSQERLVPSVAGDLLGQKTLIADLMATAELVKRLKQPEGFIGGRLTHDVLDRRVAMMVSTEKLQEILRGRTVLDKLRDLFHLQAAVAQATSTKTIDDYILQIMESRDFIGRLYDSIEGADARMRALAELQSAVLTSTFPREKRKVLAKTLDSAQHDLLKTTQILAPLRKSGRPSIEAVMTVVDLAGEAAFTRGRCMTEARELIRRHIRHKDFVRKYLKSLTPEGQTTEDLSEAQTAALSSRLSDLATRIRQAGVEFTDLGALRVLVAEDEDSARDYIAMVLRDMGILNVITAHDGRRALEVFQDFEDGIDLIICDWKMPRMSGLDFLKQVRSVRPKLPFLMVTALATMENVEEAMAHEVTAYIAKPFPPEQLEEKVLLLVNRAAPSQGEEKDG